MTRWSSPARAFPAAPTPRPVASPARRARTASARRPSRCIIDHDILKNGQSARRAQNDQLLQLPRSQRLPRQLRRGLSGRQRLRHRGHEFRVRRSQWRWSQSAVRQPQRVDQQPRQLPERARMRADQQWREPRQRSARSARSPKRQQLLLRRNTGSSCLSSPAAAYRRLRVDRRHGHRPDRPDERPRQLHR